ncbi:MAG: hypothetical protein NDJ24_08575 [Alphaproteobacteria bacterium]|nr:hypothetical protein [Alphaproteobacteria bacterium]
MTMKPEELAYRTATTLGEAAGNTFKKRAIMSLAVVGMSIGMMYAIPQGLMAGLALMTTYSLWDLKKGRDDNKTLRDGFNIAAQGLSGHDSVYQLEPLKKVCDKVTDFNKDDLNIVAHFNRDKFNVIFLGMMSVMAPVLAPMALVFMVSQGDRHTLRAIKTAAEESKINLEKKYPGQFPPTPES